MTIRFDDSLPILAQVLRDILGADGLRKSVALRESAGRLSVIVDDDLSDKVIEEATARLRDALGAYARPDRVLADRNAPGARAVLKDPAVHEVLVLDQALSIRVIDRRIIGADWMESPEPTEAYPPRIVFASLKGGVGRSTALSVLAADEARRGRNVLAIDLDLEAPGVGSMLLDEERRPRYGMMDFLVESRIGGITDDDLNDFVGTSALTAGAGLVDVVPANGTTSLRWPGNYLAKLARAMVEEILAERSVSVRAQVRRAVDRLVSRRPYDLVLVDARAGLAELSAGPLLGLGATVLLFGTPERQTVEGYRYLLAALANLIRPDSDLRWRERIKVVMSKGSHNSEVIQWFVSEMYDMFTDYLYDEVEELEGFSFDVEDQDGPHYPIVIPFDARLSEWDPSWRPSDLTQTFYSSAFGPFITKIDELILANNPAKG
jgi:Mrp family chromosome partitioning ATPase